MGWLNWLVGGPNEDHYLKPVRFHGRCALGPTEIVICDGCGAGGGKACKCDPDLGRKPKWWET